MPILALWSCIITWHTARWAIVLQFIRTIQFYVTNVFSLLGPLCTTLTLHIKLGLSNPEFKCRVYSLGFFFYSVFLSGAMWWASAHLQNWVTMFICVAQHLWSLGMKKPSCHALSRFVVFGALSQLRCDQSTAGQHDMTLSLSILFLLSNYTVHLL